VWYVALYGLSALVFTYVVSRMGKRRLSAVAVIWPVYVALWALVQIIDLVGDLGEEHARANDPALKRARSER
jgi:Na+-driven multidrug efflux pump